MISTVAWTLDSGFTKIIPEKWWHNDLWHKFSIFDLLNSGKLYFRLPKITLKGAFSISDKTIIGEILSKRWKITCGP